MAHSSHGRRDVGEADAQRVSAAHPEGHVWKAHQRVERIVRREDEGEDAGHINGGLCGIARPHQADVRLRLDLPRGVAMPGDAPVLRAEDRVVAPTGASGQPRQDLLQHIRSDEDLARPGLRVPCPVLDRRRDLLLGARLETANSIPRGASSPLTAPAPLPVCVLVLPQRLAKERSKQALGARAAAVGACAAPDHRGGGRRAGRCHPQGAPSRRASLGEAP
mmetsp:Transcript_148316/g.413126  ORF Transcript_148316/g.413126 Transcript_148316/m.413126 type:complete len:221 (+) Transcript_148316:76-738(+)